MMAEANHYLCRVHLGDVSAYENVRLTATILCIAAIVCVSGRVDPGVAASTQQAANPPVHRFTVVSGPGYEGAIVPAELVPSNWKRGRTKDFWTPDAKQVERLEGELQRYLRKALQDPATVTPRPAVSAPGGDDVVNLQWLIDHLGQFRRQYYGVVWEEQRGIQVAGFLESRFLADWRDHLIINADGGCGNWWAEFAVPDGHVLSFVCQPIGGPSA